MSVMALVTGICLLLSCSVRLSRSVQFSFSIKFSDVFSSMCDSLEVYSSLLAPASLICSVL